MSLYSKDDCRKISGNQLPSKQESPVGPLPCRDRPQRALPCPVLHPCSVMFTYSGRRRGAAGPSERGDVAYHEQEKLNWALCYWATAFFHGFLGRSIYNTHPSSLKAAQTLSQGQHLSGVELWGNKRLRLAKFLEYLMGVKREHMRKKSVDIPCPAT